jgi:hypothetical protein
VYESDSGVDLCSSTEQNCSIVFDDSSGCVDACAAAGLDCLEVWENVEDACQADTGRTELSCEVASNHESDFCLCGDAGSVGSGGSQGTGGSSGGNPDCSYYDSEPEWDLCDSTPDSCMVVFQDSAGCTEVCEAAGLVCFEVWENVEDECAGDFERTELSCDEATDHESDYCVCVSPDTGMGGSMN